MLQEQVAKKHRRHQLLWTKASWLKHMITDYGKKGEEWGKPYQRIGFYGWENFVAGAHIMAFKHKNKQWEYRPCIKHIGGNWKYLERHTPAIIDSIVVDRGKVKYKLVHNDAFILYGNDQYEEDVRIV